MGQNSILLSCSVPHSNEMVIALANKQWIKNGVGGGNAYHPDVNINAFSF